MDLKPRDAFIQAGEIAPDFVLKDQNKAEWRLSDALKKAVQQPAVGATFTKVGSAPYAGDAKEFAANVQRENDLAIAMVKAGKLKAE